MISVQQHDFNVAEEYDALRRHSLAGAIVTFCGLVRDFDQNETVNAIELEHYPAMTEKSLHDIVDQARARWVILDTRIIHRIGRLRANDQIVFVGVTSSHRHEAFNACEFIMDFLKTRAPFWKKQFSQTGDYWVEAKAKDNAAAERWQQKDSGT